MNVGSQQVLMIACRPFHQKSNNVSLIYNMQPSEENGFTACLFPSIIDRSQHSQQIKHLLST
jgi:hypothetical protein